MAGTDEPNETAASQTGWASLLFFVGLVGFVVSVVAFLADLVTGQAVGRSLAVNALAVFALVGWAARDTFRDPDAAVNSRLGAVGTGAMLYGLYLLLASLVVGVTSLRHGRLSVALVAGGVGVALVLGGFLGFPRQRVIDTDVRSQSDAPTSRSDPDGDVVRGAGDEDVVGEMGAEDRSADGPRE